MDQRSAADYQLYTRALIAAANGAAAQSRELRLNCMIQRLKRLAFSVNMNPEWVLARSAPRPDAASVERREQYRRVAEALERQMLEHWRASVVELPGRNRALP